MPRSGRARLSATRRVLLGGWFGLLAGAAAIAQEAGQRIARRQPMQLLILTEDLFLRRIKVL